MRVSKGAQARANKQAPLQPGPIMLNFRRAPGVRELRSALPAAANKAGLRSIDRIFIGRWPGHTGAAVRFAVVKRLQEDKDFAARADALRLRGETKTLEVV
jgi:hypothetical protein